MAFDELAQRLFGARRAESDAILTDATTGTIHGVALTDSEGGAVTVEITADVTAPEPLEVDGETYFADAGVGVEIPTSESVKAGDEVLVSTYGAGTMRSPVVTAAVGSGDRMAAAVTEAHDLAASVEGIAQEAKDVAEATGQHFWPDTDGVHVTEVTQDEWNDSEGTGYHSGANVLINALGQLFRDGLNNILAIVSGTDPGVAIYDGTGNDSDNIMALFSKALIRIGGKLADVGQSLASVQFFTDTGSTTDLTAEHYVYDVSAGQDPIVGHNVQLRQTMSDGQLPNGTGRTSTAGVAVSGEIYNNGTTWSETADASISACGSTANEAVSVWARIVKMAASVQRIVGLTADTLRLTYGTGSGATVKSFDMSHVADMLTTASATLTRGTGAASWTSGQVRRSGKVVVVTLVNMKLASALASGANSAVVTTVPAGYRPNVAQRVPVAMTATGAYANCWAVVGAGGNIQIHNGSGLSIANSVEISMNCCYIVD